MELPAQKKGHDKCEVKKSVWRCYDLMLMWAAF